MCPRWTSHCQGPAAACTGLDRCHPTPLTVPPSSPLSLSRVPSTLRLLDRQCLAGYMGRQRLLSFSSASRTGHLFWSASRTRGLTGRVAENILDAKTTALGEEDLEANNLVVTNF